MLLVDWFEFDFDIGFALHLGIGVHRLQGEPVVLVVVRAQVLPPDGHFANNFVLFQMTVTVEHVNGYISEIAWYLELELLAEEWTAMVFQLKSSDFSFAFSFFGYLKVCKAIAVLKISSWSKLNVQ